MPLPIHQGFVSCAAMGVSTGASDATPAPRRKFLREKTGFVKTGFIVDTPAAIQRDARRRNNRGGIFP
jgi:hypothetical protein